MGKYEATRKNVAKHPNDVWAKRTPLPHWQNPKTTGTFVGPATQQGIPTDTLMAPQIDATLLGLIGEQGKPNFGERPYRAHKPARRVRVFNTVDMTLQYM